VLIAPPPAHVPPPVVSGVHISWPAQTSLPAGSALTVKVTSARHRAQLSLVSVDRNGRAVHALARRTLRTGTFTARIGGPATYELRATVAGRKYWSWISVPAPAPAVPAPTPAPTPGPASLANDVLTCATGDADLWQLALGSSTVHPGDTLAVQLVNTGSSCRWTGVCPSLERQADDGTWSPTDTRPCIAVVVAVPPGGAFDETRPIAPDAVPGHFRVAQNGATAEFDVVPA
jgi:hypothetical protein